MLSDDIASLLGFACEAVLYGMYCIIFLASLYLTFGPSGPRCANKFVAFANILLFSVCTTHFGITFNEFYTKLAASGVEGYGDETSVGMGADTLISVADWIGEMILIYRCWAIWGHNYYVVALPFVASTAALACFGVAVHLLLGIDPTAAQPPPTLHPFVLAAYVLPLCSNFILTALIVGRIWYMSRGAVVYTVSSLQGKKSLAFRAAAIIVESGMLYLVVQVIFVTVFSLGNTADEVMAPMMAQFYGIAPTLILVQVGLGLSADEASFNSVQDGRMTFAQPSEGRRTATSGATSDYPSVGTPYASVENHIIVGGSHVDLKKYSDTKGSDDGIAV